MVEADLDPWPASDQSLHWLVVSYCNNSKPVPFSVTSARLSV